MFTGLIENVGKVRCISPAREGARLSVACDFDEYEVGESIAVNGVTGRGFEVMLIPHTQQVLMDGFVTLGRVVNIEVDILGKYVEKLSSCHCAETGDIERAPSSLTLEKLRDLGF